MREIRGERAHSGEFPHLIHLGGVASMYWGRWLTAEYALLKWNFKKRKKKVEAQGKANNWIWLSLNVSVCSAMQLCLHSWSVCPGSSQQGAGLGTAGHGYSTSPPENHYTPPSPCPSPFKNERVQLPQDEQSATLTKNATPATKRHFQTAIIRKKDSETLLS